MIIYMYDKEFIPTGRDTVKSEREEQGKQRQFNVLNYYDGRA
jgi:hypothetical protein